MANFVLGIIVCMKTGYGYLVEQWAAAGATERAFDRKLIKNRPKGTRCEWFSFAISGISNYRK
jgi:hypothetical protein